MVLGGFCRFTTIVHLSKDQDEEHFRNYIRSVRHTCHFVICKDSVNPRRWVEGTYQQEIDARLSNHYLLLHGCIYNIISDRAKIWPIINKNIRKLVVGEDHVDRFAWYVPLRLLQLWPHKNSAASMIQLSPGVLRNPFNNFVHTIWCDKPCSCF